jgi:DNA-directed RNA polymerase subunit RPC12/RpoP
LYKKDKVLYRCNKCGTPLITFGEIMYGLCKECGVEQLRADREARARRTS